MALKDIFEQNTADIAEATELLKVLSDITGLYVWEKLTAEGGESLGYVVADDETSYPNGGELDGYWYESVVGMSVGEYLTPENFGFTKVAVDTMVYSGSYSISDLTVTHSLNEIPKMVIIRPKTALKFTQASELSFLIGRANVGQTTNNLYVHMWYQANNSPNKDSLMTGGAAYSISNVTATNFRLPKASAFNSYYWSAGIEYEVITFA